MAASASVLARASASSTASGLSMAPGRVRSSTCATVRAAPKVSRPGGSGPPPPRWPVEGHHVGLPRPKGLLGQGQAGEPFLVRRLEGELPPYGRNPAAGRRRALDGVAHGVPDGGAHIRRAQLGQHRSVGKLHHGMDHRLGMHHRLQRVRRHAEQVVGLDELQSLVHHGGAVHGDLAPHSPGRMGQHLGRGGAFNGLPGPVPQGAPRGGENQPHPAGCPPRPGGIGRWRYARCLPAAAPPPGPWPASSTSRPPVTSASLLASRTRSHTWAAVSTAPSPATPTTAHRASWGRTASRAR